MAGRAPRGLPAPSAHVGPWARAPPPTPRVPSRRPPARAHWHRTPVPHRYEHQRRTDLISLTARSIQARRASDSVFSLVAPVRTSQTTYRRLQPLRLGTGNLGNRCRQNRPLLPQPISDRCPRGACWERWSERPRRRVAGEAGESGLHLPSCSPPAPAPEMQPEGGCGLEERVVNAEQRVVLFAVAH